MLITIIAIFFWFSIFMTFYAYFGYPSVLAILSLFLNKPTKQEYITPYVSFIITAYNEEKSIVSKIENTLAQDYPKDKLEIIVASDCSTDATDEIAKSHESKGVKLVRAPKRRGKENAQKCAVDVALGEILVFSDTATILDVSGVRNIVKSFADPTVGCVSSVDRFLNRDGEVSGEGAYVKYEMLLRTLESRVSTLVGLSGSFFATRKKLCNPWATDLQSDFNTLINSVKKGYRGVCDEGAIGYYRDLTENKQEFNRKVRTVVRGIRVFMGSLSMLNVFKYGLFSWQFFSHKLCRWLVPFWMIIAMVSNILLLRSSTLYLGLFILQSVFYALSLVGTMMTHTKKRTLKLPSFFVAVNLSILMAWYKYSKGDNFNRWEPSVR
jgi:glycosyltransferase involved in cell wall biosynthesis